MTNKVVKKLYGKKTSVSAALLIAILAISGLLSTGMLTFATAGETQIALPAPISDYVTVYRDNEGVPHIYANNVSDAYFAWGYVMAEDRLFQMDLYRRTTAGRLSELFGSSELSSDEVMRTLGIWQIANDTWNGAYADAIVTPDIRQNLEQFSNGVNRYIADMAIPNGVPIEYRVLAAASGLPLALFLPYSWTPVDSVAIAGMMGLMLTDTSQAEIIKGALSFVNSALSDFLMPVGWVNMTTISMPDPALTDLSQIEPITAPVQKALGFTPGVSGSNNWVISGLNTTNGYAMLANDPHLALSTPGIWWEVQVDVPGWADVIGCCVPGGPAISTGHNDNIAFGVTNIMADVMDLYYYNFNSTSITPSTTYYNGTGWEPLQVEYQTIFTAPQGLVMLGVPPAAISTTIPVYSTQDGPLVSTPLGEMAVKWAGALTGYGEIEGFSLIENATNLDQWKNALSHMCVIDQNFVAADTSGNIAWCEAGKLPERQPPGAPFYGTMGVVPSNGSADQNEWIGWIPPASNPAPLPYPYNMSYSADVSMPFIENPPQGFIATANNQPVGPGWPGYPWPLWIAPEYDYDPGFRAQRITDLIKELAPISIADMETIQADTFCIPAQTMLPLIIPTLNNTLSPFYDANATIQNALNILSSWNYMEQRNMVAPLLWEVFLNDFAYNTFGPSLAPYGLYPFPNMIVPLVNMTETWQTNPYALGLFGYPTTYMPQIADESLHEALDWIASQLGNPFGTTFSNWQYGDLHVVQFAHPLGALGLYFLSVPAAPVGCDGGPFTVDPGYYQSFSGLVNAPLLVGEGSSYRGIYECNNHTDWDTSLILVPPGESGLTTYNGPYNLFTIPLLNPHYGDTFLMWLNCQYTPCLYNDTIIQAFPSTVFYPAVHDVAITNVTPSSTVVIVGNTLQVDVTAANNGIYAEDFSVTLYYNSNVIGTQAVTGLAPHATMLLTFNWDTTGVTPDDYNITAVASTVPGETYRANNVNTVNVIVGTVPGIEVEPPVYNVQRLNKTFSVNVTVSDLGQYWRAVGLQFRLCYDDTLLQFDNITEGPFMQDPRWNLQGTDFISFNETDPVYGPSVVVGILLLPNDTGKWNAFPFGSGTLATLTFTPKVQQIGLKNPPLTCNLHLVQNQIVDDNLNDVLSSTMDGLYKMLPTNAADLNNDYKVDMKDIAVAGAAFGSTRVGGAGQPVWNPIADITGPKGVPDGKVDMRDVALIAANFGWTALDP